MTSAQENTALSVFAQAHPALYKALCGYTGPNVFLLKMISVLNSSGSLTEGQAMACNRMLANAQASGVVVFSEPHVASYSNEHLGTPGERLRGQLCRVVDCRLIRQPIFPRGAVYIVGLETTTACRLTWFTGRPQETTRHYKKCDFTVKGHQVHRGANFTKISRLVFK